ncbi:hypothetical protein OROMI_010490 [Orobanche minor]
MEYKYNNKTTKMLVVMLFLVFLIIPNHCVFSSSSLSPSSSSSLFFQEKRFCFFTHKFVVRVINELPEDSPFLKLHCASGDDDLGYHDLPVNQVFGWSFCSKLVGDSLFFCHLWWGSRNRAFVALNTSWCDRCSKCNYTAKTDGIYLNGKRTFTWKVE